MNWHYLRGEEADSWRVGSSDGVPSALARLIPTGEKSSSLDKWTDLSAGFQSGRMSEPSMGNHGRALSMSSRGGSLVKILVRQDAERDSEEIGRGYGLRCSESFVRWTLSSSSRRTLPSLIVGDSIEYYPIFPKSGTMRGGVCWAHIISEPLKKEIGSGFWPTPTASEAGLIRREDLERMPLTRTSRLYRKGAKMHTQQTLNRSVKLWEVSPSSGKLNPDWVEWLMGWPIGWTALAPLATDRFQQWRRRHGIY